jgi:CTP:molybdopterin cytidylyltransferase MocA
MPVVPKIAAIVLAAGMSKRMGAPKALLPIDGQAMLERVLATLEQSRVFEHVIVVTGHEPNQLQRILTRHRVAIAHNADFERGEMISSIKTGLRALAGNIDAAMIVLCDQPMVKAATLVELVESWRARRPRVLLPTYHGKRGHPVILAASGFAEIISLPPQATLKTYTLAHASETCALAVDDEAVVRDIDTPADYQAELKRSSSCPDDTAAV